MLIMTTSLSPSTKTSFPCVSLLACSNSWEGQHFVTKNKPLAAMSTNFSESFLTLNQSIPIPRNKTSLLGAAFTRQGTSNRQLKHITHGSTGNSSNYPVEMGELIREHFPINLGEDSETIAKNGERFRELQCGIKYIDIKTGNGKKGDENDYLLVKKFDIHYKLFDEKKNFKYPKDQKEITLENLGTGLREGIKGMMSQGRRLIIVPPDLADDEHVNKGEYAIYDVIIEKIHHDHLLKRVCNGGAAMIKKSIMVIRGSISYDISGGDNTMTY